MEFHSKIYKISCVAGRSFFGALLLLWLMSFGAFGQENLIRITTNVLPPYSPYIQDYPGTGNRVQVFVSNLSGKDLSVRLIGKLEGDNGVVIRTSPNYRPLQPLQLRATDVNRLVTRSELEGLFDLNQIEVQGMNKNELYKGLPLPEGNYQLCVQAFDNATIRPLSAEFPMGCSGLIPVRIVEPPILISPFENEEVLTKIPQTQMFTWSAPVGIMPNQVEYTLRIVELPAADVNPNVFIDAVVLPRSGLEVKNLRTSSFLYGPSHPALQVGKKYAWRVQAHSTAVKLNLMNDGKSPVGVFTYGQQAPVGVEFDYISIVQPTEKKGAMVEVGSNNPLIISWKLDQEFEKILRKAYEAPAGKSLLEQFGELSYNVRISSKEKGEEPIVVMERQVRTDQLWLNKSELPDNMQIGKNYQVQVELKGVTEVKRKRTELVDEPFISNPQSFLLVAKDKGDEKDSLTIRGILAYRFPGETGAAHVLPNTKVVLMKVFPNKFRATVAYGQSDASGNYKIKVSKMSLHGMDSSGIVTRCIVDPINPFIQPIAEPGYYQNSHENTFQISSAEQGDYDVKDITWLASGYNLDVTARKSFKNWPGVPDVNLEGKHLVIYRKNGVSKENDKYRLPFEGMGAKAEKSAPKPFIASVNQGVQNMAVSGIAANSGQQKSEKTAVDGYAVSKNIGADLKPTNLSKADIGSTVANTAVIDNNKTGKTTFLGSTLSSGLEINTGKGLSTDMLNGAGLGNTKPPKLALEAEMRMEVESKGHQFISMATLEGKGDGYGAMFENLVYAIGSSDVYQIYCPDCGLKPEDADPVVFVQPKEKLTSTPARVEKYTYNLQTTEAPTMTFTGKLTYKFADDGIDGAQVKALGKTQVHLQVVYKNLDQKASSFTTDNYTQYDELASFHDGYSTTLDTKVTDADGSFSFTVKMTKAMLMGALPTTKPKGSGEFSVPATNLFRGIRVIVDNPYYTSPIETFGMSPDQQMKAQGSYDFGPVTAEVKSYTLVTQIKSDTTGISLVNVQKAGIRSDLSNINVSVLRATSAKIGVGPNRRPPSDEGSGVKEIIKIKDQSYTVISTVETKEDGIARFPRMVMANGQADAYFIATKSSVDGLNNYNLVAVKRITVSEGWGAVFSPEATQEEKDRSNGAKKTVKNGAKINCRNVYTLLYGDPKNTVKSVLKTYEEAEYMEKQKETYGNPWYSWKPELAGCQPADNYWLGEKLRDVKVNDMLLLNTPNNARAAAQFTDQYETFNSDIVQRYLAPGNPTVNARVVDQSNPTQGIKGARVELSYVKDGAPLGIPTVLTRYTGEDGWIAAPFKLSPGNKAKMRIQAEGYVYYDTLAQKASGKSEVYIGDVLLGQNSYYDRILMMPNTVITGRAVNVDELAGGSSFGNINTTFPESVSVTGGVSNTASPTTVSTVKIKENTSSKTTTGKVAGKTATTKIATSKATTATLGSQKQTGQVAAVDKNVGSEQLKNIAGQSQTIKNMLDSDPSLEAYVQVDDGNMVKTNADDGTWKFTLDAPSTGKNLKVFPVNIRYFEEARKINTQLPKPVLGKDGRYSIVAGDIPIFERDHRITFKILDEISGKEISGAYVRLFAKKGTDFEFGPSKVDGLVETRFKNVSVDNLYVEVVSPGYVTRTVSIKNEESKKPVLETIRLEPARTVKGIVVMKSLAGIETPLEGAEVFVAAGENAGVKYSTVSGKDGLFALDVSRTLDGNSVVIETIFDKTTSANQSVNANATYVGSNAGQPIPQGKGQILKMTVTTFDKFRIASIWGFPVTIEKLDPKTMKVTGEVDLTDGGLGPFAMMNKKVKVRFEDVVFKADPQNASEGIPANETVELNTGILDNLLYHTSPNVDINKVKYNVKVSSPDGQYGKLKIVRTAGTAMGKIMAQAQVIDNSFNFSESLLSYEKGQFFLYDPEVKALLSSNPVVTAFDAAKTNIKWTNFGISQSNGTPMKLKLLGFNAVSKLEGSRLTGDEIHLNPVMSCTIKDANPSELKVSIGDLVLKNNTVDAKTGDTPLTFPLAGKWSVEIRNWKLDYKKGGFYSKSGVIKTGKADIPVKEFNLRSDFYNLQVEPTSTLELAGVAKLKVGGKAYFGYDKQTGSDMKGHWAVVVVPDGDAPAAVLPAKSVPGLTQDLEFATLSLLDNGEDVVSFGTGSKSFRYFNIIDVRPTTIETGSDYFAFDAGMSNAIPNAPQDVSMRFIYSKPDGGSVKLKTIIPGGYKLQTKGYLNFEAGQHVAADKSQSTAIFFGDGVMAIRGSVEEPGKLLLDNVLLVHNNTETHISHGRNLDLTNPANLSNWKTSLSGISDPAKDAVNYDESGDFKRLNVSLGGNSSLGNVYCHQTVTNKKWDLLKFSGRPQGFSEMLGDEEKNRLSFTAYGEIKAEGQKIELDGIDTGMGGLSLVYDHGKKRLTGSIQLSNIPIPPTMTFMKGMAQVRLDGNGFYLVATGELQNVPLIVPVTMRAGLMLGVYTSNDLGDAKQVLFTNSHRKELPCTFTSGFKGVYAVGEVPVPIIGSFKHELSVPGVGGYKVGVDAYVDGYVFGNYDKGTFGVGGGMGVGVHAYAYGSILSLSAGGEVHVNGGVETALTVNPGVKKVSVSVAAKLSSGFSVSLSEGITGVTTGANAGFCLGFDGTASYTFGQSPDVSITPTCSFEECTGGCKVDGQ
ncbi:hypothetical protein [Dyadobacter sp. CY312]|uniref:hypothetical protein n=1 Tax=Dyadobacter sp. CY312 TaxID=2907303 RepID=UPI001F325F87|nr:hypothetical protein [Dyadobacter sp. CY312]MCE7043284.1 hypothetical protein [Dyadobacter sp. CY312]